MIKMRQNFSKINGLADVEKQKKLLLFALQIQEDKISEDIECIMNPKNILVSASSSALNFIDSASKIIPLIGLGIRLGKKLFSKKK